MPQGHVETLKPGTHHNPEVTVLVVVAPGCMLPWYHRWPVRVTHFPGWRGSQPGKTGWVGAQCCCVYASPGNLSGLAEVKCFGLSLRFWVIQSWHDFLEMQNKELGGCIPSLDVASRMRLLLWSPSVDVCTQSHSQS